MVKGDFLPISFNKEKPARIGLLRRDAPGGNASEHVSSRLHKCGTGLGIWGLELPS